MLDYNPDTRISPKEALEHVKSLNIFIEVLALLKSS
jgi:hypothetical protein